MLDIPERFKVKTLMTEYPKVISAYAALQRMLTPEGWQHVATIMSWTRAVFAAIGQYSRRAEELEAEVQTLRVENAALRAEKKMLEDVLGAKLELTEKKK